MMLLTTVLGAWLGLGFVLAVLLGRGIATDSDPASPEPASRKRERPERIKHAA